MKKLLLLGCFAIVICKFTFGQVTFQRSYGTSGLDLTYAMLADQTADGGYGLCSYTSYTGMDSAIYFVRLDSIGAVMWSKKYNDGWTDPFAMQATSDGGFIIAGATNDSLVSIGAYLLKIDSNGNILWSRAFGGAWLEQAFGIQETSDGGFIVVGETQSFSVNHTTELYLFKTSPYGNLEWARAIGDSMTSGGYSVAQTWDGGFVASGSTAMNGGGAYLVKTDSMGTLLWTQVITPGVGMAYSITECSDHSLALITTHASGMTLIRTDSGGNFLWAKAYGNASGVGMGYCITQTSDDGFALAGYNSNLTGIDLLKTDSSGVILWAYQYASAGNFPTTIQPFTLGETMDGGFFICNSDANANGDLLLIKTDAQGQSGCNQTSVNVTTTNLTLTCTPEGISSFAPGQFFGHTMMSVIPTNVNTYCGMPIGIEETQVENVVLYPNPSSGIFNVHTSEPVAKLSVVNVLGEIVYESFVVSGDQQIDLSSQPNGIYFVNVISEKKTFTQKIVIQK